MNLSPYRLAVEDVRNGSQYLEELVGGFLKEKKDCELGHLNYIQNLIDSYSSLALPGNIGKVNIKAENFQQEIYGTEEDIFYDAVEAYPEPILNKQFSATAEDVLTQDEKEIFKLRRSAEEEVEHLEDKVPVELSDNERAGENLQDKFR